MFMSLWLSDKTTNLTGLSCLRGRVEATRAVSIFSTATVSPVTEGMPCHDQSTPKLRLRHRLAVGDVLFAGS